MSSRAIRAAVLATLNWSLTGQQSPESAQERIFRFAHTESAQEQQEITTVIRSIAEIRHASVDTAQRVLALRGTSGQIAAAEWLFAELDRPPTARSSDTHEYKLADTADNTVRVLYVRNVDTVQDLQEVATVIRSTAEIRRAFTYNAPRALVLRATPEQIALAEWLLGRLTQPSGTPETAQYLFPDTKENVVRVFYLRHAATVQDVQEIATVVRSTGEIRRAFVYNRAKALAVRGNAEQVALAEWLLGELDRPIGRQTMAREYRVPAVSDDVVRVFWLPESVTVERLQQVATHVRTMTEARRLFVYRAPRAMVLRGTADQIARADRLLRELER